jgi:fructokinase
MSTIYAIGEIVFDIIFHDSQPQQANAGGSMLNSAISLSRTGLAVSFIGETGNDEVGNTIRVFLNNNNINTDYIQAYTDYKSSIALAFLNDKNDASYVFYKDYPNQRLTLDLPIPKEGDIVLFGSSFALHSAVRHVLIKLLHTAKEQGAIIMYDPNIRKQSIDKNEVKKMVLENISMADIVRGSDEDFNYIFDTYNENDIYESVKANDCNNLIITRNSNDVLLLTPNIIHQFTVSPIITKSTIGAGDNFNAGLIYGLYQQGISKQELAHCTLHQWQPIIENGIAFASHVCQSFDNYISEAFAEKYSIEKY